MFQEMMMETPEPRGDRRRFLMLMGLAGASSALARAGFAAAPADSTSSTPPASTPAPAAGAAQSTEPSEEARLLAEALRKRFPSLSDEEVRTIAGDIDDRLEAGRALRKLALGNADEPDFRFEA
jgi:hypothetical protein